MKKIINGSVYFNGDLINMDILIENEKIKAIGSFNDIECEEIIDAKGLKIFPGGIDPHTHMELQQSEKYKSCDDFYEGGVAAAFGGTTTIIDHIGFGPKGCKLEYSINEYFKKADKCPIDYSFHGVIQHVDDEIIDELKNIVENRGITSFKAYSTYGFKVGDEGFYRLLKAMKECNGILTVHSENDEITNYLRNSFALNNNLSAIDHAKTRPNETESEVIKRLIEISKMVNDANLYIVHTSTKEGVEAIKEGKKTLKNLYGETCPQYLFLQENEYIKNGNQEGLKFIMSPPLRKKEDNNALISALKDGTMDTLGTDHCPFKLKEKLDGINDYRIAPGGAPGVEERIKLIYSELVMKNKMSYKKFVEVTSENVAKIFGLYPKKGNIGIGADADLLFIKEGVEETISEKNSHSTCDYSIYEGKKINCKIDKVMLRGHLIVDNDKFIGERGKGQFLKRNVLKNTK